MKGVTRLSAETTKTFKNVDYMQINLTGVDRPTIAGDVVAISRLHINFLIHFVIPILMNHNKQTHSAARREDPPVKVNAAIAQDATGN